MTASQLKTRMIFSKVSGSQQSLGWLGNYLSLSVLYIPLLLWFIGPKNSYSPFIDEFYPVVTYFPLCISKIEFYKPWWYEEHLREVVSRYLCSLVEEDITPYHPW